MTEKKFIKQLGYEYICNMLEESSPNDKYYKLLKKRKKKLEKKYKILL